MDKSVTALFSQTILEQALHAYGIECSTATLLDGFESFIYQVSKNGKDYILRIGHSARRSPDLIRGESEFLNYLSEGGLSVPQVFFSEAGKLVEEIKASDGSFFLTTLFEKAPGRPPKRKEFGPALFFNMGCFMGKLHRLSKDFNPSQPRFKRFSIEDDLVVMEASARKYLPECDEPVLMAYKETAAAISELPKFSSTYGLCHIDFHGGNFFLTDEGKITLFDFDDCQYAWFVYDIAMALFYAISHDCTRPEELAEAEGFLQHFWQGYVQFNNLDSSWLQQIPLFLKLREIDLYILIHRSMDLDNLDPWCASFMANRRKKIIEATPYCNISYGC